MKYFFLDIETNSSSLEFNKDDQEIIQIGIYDSESHKKFTKNINIGKPLSENIKRLTGITDDDINKGTDLKTALNDAIKFLGNIDESIIVGHNIEDFDLYILGKNDKRFLEYKYIDSLHLFLFLYPGLKSYTVQELYKNFINSEYNECHQALQDSIDEYELFSKTMNVNFLSTYYKERGKNISFVKNLTKKYDGSLNENCHNINFINDILSDIELDEYVGLKDKLLNKRFFNYLTINKEENIKVQGQPKLSYNKISKDEMDKFYMSFINNTNNSIRNEQLSMIQHIKDVLNRDNENLFIEAGTGTGKTFGYLLPAIKFVEKNKDNKRLKIFVATYTKVLQNQIIEKDAVFLKKHFPNIKFELLKATTEGIALDNVPFKGQLSIRDLALWNRLYWGNFYVSDIHFSLQLKIGFDKLKFYIPGDGENMDLDKEYGFRGKLSYQLYTGNIFIINQAFLTTKFNPITKNKYTGIVENIEFPPIDIINTFEPFLIIDEGHNRENVVREFFTIDYTKNQFDNILGFFGFSNKYNIISYVNKHIESAKKKLEGFNEILSIQREIEQLELIKRYLTKWIISPENEEIFNKYQKFLSDFPSSRFCKVAYDDIINLRNLGYDTTISEYDKISFNEWYNPSYLKDFLSYTLKTINDLFIEVSSKSGKETKYIQDFIYGFIKYFKIGLYLLDNNDKDYFFNSLVEISETGNNIKNFGFQAIPINLKKGVQFLNLSLGNIVLSATLFDKNKESYVLREIFDKKFNSAKIMKYDTPFKYNEQRHLYAINNSDKNILQGYMYKFIEKYGGRTLILTTTLAEKRRLANLCKNKYEKDGILVLMHKSGTLDSSTNQRNIQALRDNPKTILIGSKSYAEGVDIPGDNLKLVIIDKLPFLPPRPFIKFQDNKRKSKGNKFVYKFLCSINFRQSIGRLIRTKTDSGDILILDERILQPSGQFFKDYIEGEIINEL